MIAWISGFIGGLAGNLTDVINVRMQFDAGLPVENDEIMRTPCMG